MPSIEDLSPGTRVEYHPTGNRQTASIGKVIKILTHEEIAGSTPRHIHADEEHPRVLIENEHTGKESAVKFDMVMKIIGKGSPKTEEGQGGDSTYYGGVETKGNVDINSLHPGMHVEYHPVRTAANLSTGKIVKILTHEEVAGSTQKHIHADQQHPRIVIENDHTRKETAYKAENITRVIR